ncbi:MAG: hypothetical protein EOP84_19725 [Verrucomicrobiaceae bacterium]|nr:MAG: hypothetical protein EOP84_19725 [Verrucomicrobiaceae bacterium]
MKNLSKQTLLAVTLACGLSVASAQQSSTQTPGTPLGGQGGGVSTSQPGETSKKTPAATSPTTETAETSTSGASKPATPQSQDGIVKYRGAVMFVKYGKPQPVKNEMKLSEGITVQPSGDVELKDGTKMTLQEGQMVTLDSQVTTIPPAMANTLSNQAGTESAPANSPRSEGTGGGSTSTQPAGSDATDAGSTPGAAGRPATSGASGSTSGTTTGSPASGGK